jgi:hypothetical protein
MCPSREPPPRNYRRRSLGVAICLAPLALLAASLVCGMMRPTGVSSVGLGLVLFAGLIAALNLHLSSLRPLLYRWRHGSMDHYRNVSGLPAVGTFGVLAGALLGFGNVATALAGLAVFLADTGGSFWFLVATWQDTSLWDE